MSEPILPKRQWPAGIQQASVPANDNSLRDEALFRPCLGVANDATGTDADGDVWLVGSAPTGAFAAFSENDIALYHVDPGTAVAGWSAWAPTDGLRLVVNDVRKVFNGTAWIDDPSGGGGSGDVVGPASSVDSHVALFDGTTGKLLKDGGALGGMAGINDAPSDGTGYVRKDGGWAAESGGGGGGMTNPMTTAGDIIYGGSGGTPARLAAGTDGYVLTLVSGSPAWAAAGGGGGGLTNWAESVNTSAPNTTVPVVQLLATDAATNVDAVISAKGTGAIAAHVSNGTATGGNKRGANAVDWQQERATAAQVASGTNSFIGSGRRNTASGADSACASGFMNQATGQGAFVGAGSTNIASGTYSSVSGGSSNTVDAQESWCPGGSRGVTRGIVGSGTRAAGRFSWDGDAQSMCFVLRRSASNATPVVLTTNAGAPSAANQVALPSNSDYIVKGSIVAREASTGDSAKWEFTACIRRAGSASTTTMDVACTPVLLYAAAGASTWTVSVTADTTNAALKIEVTGEASKSLKWVADIYSCVQVVG